MDSLTARHQVSLSQRDQGQWLQIQKNTFTNWVNECLRSRSIVVEELRTDLSDGVNLVALVESLARHKIAGTVHRPSNQYEKLQNIALALDAVSKDGVKIVNIDSSDIMACNMKLVLALVWQLILKYQIGLSAARHRSWILQWLRAVLPECSVSNLTTDWNDGILLHALLEFCKPGLSPGWMSMDRDNRVDNCRTAMKLARQHFNVPLILRPEDLASAQLDERSAITYMSYFIRVGGPGYDATLERVIARTHPKVVTNFTTDWQDGQALVHLVFSAGGAVDLSDVTRGQPLQLLTKSVNAGKALGVEPLLTPEEMHEEVNEHLGMMAYCARFLPYSNRSQNMYNGTTLFTANEHLSVRNIDINRIADVKQPLQVTTEYRDDMSSTHTSTIMSPKPTSVQPVFQLVTANSKGTASRVEAPAPEQLKVDVYSVGVIMECKITGDFDPEKFKIEANSPNGRVIRMSGNGHYAAQFAADEIGTWYVAMSYDGRPMDNSPIDVCDPSKVTIKDMKGGILGRANNFRVDCSGAGQGDVGVDITHQGRPVSSFVSRTQTPNMFNISFTPFSVGPYEINVHFNRAEIREADFHHFDPEEKQRKAVFNTEVEPKDGYIEVKCTCDWEIDYITGGPFICHVGDTDNIPVYSMTDGTVCGRPQLIVDCRHAGDGPLNAEMVYQGRTYPCKVRRDKEQPLMYRVQIKPRGPGTYRVCINYNGRPIKGSPFTQHIAELESASADGDGLYRGVPGKPATFTIDPKGGSGEVAVTVHGPSKLVASQVVPQDDNHTILATYHPVERGPHKVHVKLDGKDITGSPFSALIVDPVKVRVSGGWRPLLDDAGVIPLMVGKEKVLPFDVSEAGPGELTSSVEGPQGKIPVAIDARKDGKHSVIFTPREEGKHYIHVNWGSYPLSSSPYLGIATPDTQPEEAYPNVRLVHAPLHSPVSSVASSWVDGPLVSLRSSQPDSLRPNSVIYYQPHVQHPPTNPEPVFLFNPNATKPHYRRPTIISLPDQLPVKLVNADNMMPTPPASTSPLSPTSHGGPQKVVLSGRGLKVAVVDSPAVFYVDGTKANPGSPTPALESIRHQVPVTSEPVRPNVYRCTYVPKHPGAYLLHVNWNAKPLRGSPFKVNIRDKTDPRRVLVSFDPKGGTIGKDLEMKIDPREAGPGELTVKCTDPVSRDVPCRLNDNNDGTQSLKVRPVMPGKHKVDIRYSGDQIMGSPYVIDIATSQVKGDVKVWGPGIEDGVIPHFQSTFWVETTGAGSGDLRVRIMGPKGAFHVKMRKASQTDKIYQCFFDPVEPGVYTVHVQWSGVHVQDSPFTVLLGTTPQDVDRMKAELRDNQIANDNYSSVSSSTTTNSILRRNTKRGSSVNSSILY